MGPSALVSIVIPAYKAKFFEAALRSALAQDYPSIEIIIGDDCPTTAIKSIVEQLEPESPWPIKYKRNDVQLKEAPNVTDCVRRASGQYIKFLYDDDLLEPNCVRRQVETFEAYPGLSLVTARRQLIDENDRQLPDTYATRFPFQESTVVRGWELTSFIGEYTFNFIGEPTSVLCRRADLLDFGDSIFGLMGQHIDWLGDLAIYAKLMRQGDIAMLNETLTSYRVSSYQFSQGGRDDYSGPQAFHKLFRRLLLESGWVRASADNTHVNTCPLANANSSEPTKPYDLAAWLHEVLPGFAQPDFKHWLLRRNLGPSRQVLLDNHAVAQGGGPAVLIVISDLANDEASMLQTLTSLDRRAPLLSRTTVVVLSTRPGVGSGKVEEGLYWVSSNLEQRAGHLNQLVSEVSFDWFLHLQAGVRLSQEALNLTLIELLGKPACPAIFCDEIYADRRGGLWPLLRSSFNFDQLLSLPLGTASHWLFQRDALIAVDGFDGNYPEALELDLILRLIESGQQGFGHISEPLVIRPVEDLHSNPDESRALLDHLSRRGYSNARVGEGLPRHYEIDYNNSAPSIAVLISASGSLDRIRRCVTSVLMNTLYASFQTVLVETEQTSLDVQQWMEELASDAHGKVLTLRSDEKLKLNAALNGAVDAVEQDYVVFLDPDCIIADGQWLTLLIDQAMRPEIAAVSPRRVERGELLKDAGVRLGLEGPAETALFHQVPAPLEFGQVQRNVIGISSDCFMIAKAKFKQVGGFDEERFATRWADVDLSLKLHWAGYLNLWTPRAWVALTEPVRRAQSASATDAQAMYAAWGGSLGRDPTASHLYQLRGTGFEFDRDPQILWRPLSFAGLPVIVGSGQPGALDYRIGKPLETMRYAGLVEGGLIDHTPLPSEWLRLMPGTVVVPASALHQVDLLDVVKVEFAPCRVCDLAHADEALIASKALELTLGRFDRVLVATSEQAERLSGTHSNIEVIPTLLPPDLWANLSVSTQTCSKVRVGLVCDQPQELDLELLGRLMEDVAGEVTWVVYGQLPEPLRESVHEFHPAVDPIRYPSHLAGLGIEIAIVAVAQTFSASARSEQRVLEHGACGSAVITSSQSEWPALKVEHTGEAFRLGLRQWLDNRNEARVSAERLQVAVSSEGLLQGESARCWLAAWRPLEGLPKT